VFGLGEQVHGQPVGVEAAIADDEDFRRACDHVDAHLTKNLFFGRGDIDIAGAYDLVDPGYRRSPVGQGRHGLGTAYGKYPVYTRQPGRRHDPGIGMTLRRGHHHDDFRHTRHPGRYHVHQHRRRVGCLAARYINAHPIQRGDLLTQYRATGFGVVPGLQFLVFGVLANAVGGRFQGFRCTGIQ